MPRVFLTHPPGMLENYYGARAVAGLEALAEVAVIPGISHYGIYGQAREEATRLAIEWFDQHLKR